MAGPGTQIENRGQFFGSGGGKVRFGILDRLEERGSILPDGRLHPALMLTCKPCYRARQVVDWHSGEPAQARVPLPVGDYRPLGAGHRLFGRIRPRVH